jgi:hypothetical protein
MISIVNHTNGRLTDEEVQKGIRPVNRRHVAPIRKNCESRDLDCRRRQRQAVLHWAYDSRRI